MNKDNYPVPASIKIVVNIIEGFFSNIKTSRPEYFKTLTNGIEVETKIEISDPEDVSKLVDILKPFGLGGAEIRRENHTIYNLNSGAHLALIKHDMDREIWIKLKSKNKPITSLKYKYPFVIRKGEKLKPEDQYYDKYYAHARSKAPLTSFKKICANLFYVYKDNVYSLSFSLAWDNRDFIKQDMELEYEGSTVEGQVLTSEQGVSLMEQMVSEVVPSELKAKLSSVTKFEVLSSKARNRRAH